MARLTTQEQILIELKKQNALLEEQLRPQREEERRRELWKQEQEDKYKLERELNQSRRVIAERHLKIQSIYALLESFSNARCPIDTNNYMGDAGITPHQHEEIRKWREGQSASKLKVEEELTQLHVSEAKHLTKLRKYYKPHIYTGYIESFIRELRAKTQWELVSHLKNPWGFRVRL